MRLRALHSDFAHSFLFGRCVSVRFTVLSLRNGSSPSNPELLRSSYCGTGPGHGDGGCFGLLLDGCQISSSSAETSFVTLGSPAAGSNRYLTQYLEAPNASETAGAPARSAGALTFNGFYFVTPRAFEANADAAQFVVECSEQWGEAYKV